MVEQIAKIVTISSNMTGLLPFEESRRSFARSEMVSPRFWSEQVTHHRLVAKSP